MDTKMELTFLIITLIYVNQFVDSVIMRNNALMNKMVSQFQEKGVNPSEEIELKDNSDDVVLKMQNVLCHNFQMIPCDMILKDFSLRSLIERSIQQIKYKKMNIDKSTPSPSYQLTLFPVINSEDISNFVNVNENNNFERKNKKHKKNKTKSSKNYFMQDSRSNKKKDTKTAVFNNRNKMRKFYPHKIKYKDKKVSHDVSNNYSDEKLSMSVELPDNTPKKGRFTFRNADPSVWRIDYMKHGEPSINTMYGYEQDLKGKLVKTGPNVIVDDNYIEQPQRKDVLHPDVYIKNNYVRKHPAHPTGNKNY